MQTCAIPHGGRWSGRDVPLGHIGDLRRDMPVPPQYPMSPRLNTPVPSWHTARPRLTHITNISPQNSACTAFNKCVQGLRLSDLGCRRHFGWPGPCAFGKEGPHRTGLEGKVQKGGFRRPGPPSSSARHQREGEGGRGP